MSWRTKEITGNRNPEHQMTLGQIADSLILGLIVVGILHWVLS